jgi:excisionase family DNA binding protein
MRSSKLSKMNKLMILTEVSTLLRLSAPVLKKMCREHEIPCIKIRKSWRFDRDELTAWLKNR